MPEDNDKLTSIFFPEIQDDLNRASSGEIQFVHYTSAEAAASIIQNKEVWLRNTQGMNDYSEVQHGLDCLIKAYRNDDPRNRLKPILEEIYPGSVKKLEAMFNGWAPHFLDDTYIACISEHLPDEDQYGRLSMWRAYGRNRAVAILLNTEALFDEGEPLKATISKVSYWDSAKFMEEFFSFSDRMENNIPFLRSLDENTVLHYIFTLFQHLTINVKHPGFKEEREWRISYTPVYRKSDIMTSKIVSIGGMPQEVHIIPLRKYSEDSDSGATIAELVKKIILGPNDDQNLLKKTFIKLLRNAGCEEPEMKIHASGIPLRT